MNYKELCQTTGISVITEGEVTEVFFGSFYQTFFSGANTKEENYKHSYSMVMEKIRTKLFPY